MSIVGKVHSIESCGILDGPGIRFVTFMQGCPLRCKYCHNPDTWNTNSGTSYTPEELFYESQKYLKYINFSHGGVTMTGGEPLLQSEFVLEYFKLCHNHNIHTALDTSGFIFNNNVKQVLKYTNLVLLDIKNFDEDVYKKLTNVELAPTLTFLEYLKEQNTPVIVRYVVVPNWTDNLSAIKKLSLYLNKFPNLVHIELLPFHKMGEFKWEDLGTPYELTDTLEPDNALMTIIYNILSTNGKKVL